MSVFPGLGSLRAFHRLGMRGALSGSKAPFRQAQGPELVAGLTTLGPSKGRSKRRVPVCLCGNLVLQPVVPVAWMSVIPIHGQAHAVINGNVEQEAFREGGGSHGHRSIRRSLNAGRVAFQAFCASGRAVVMTKFARPERGGSVDGWAAREASTRSPKVLESRDGARTQDPVGCGAKAGG